MKFWIESIDFAAATGELRELYERIGGPKGELDNILQVHALRPHTLTGHMGLYKNVLHHRKNTLEKWFLELVGVYVSYLNRCDYCYRHHFAGMMRLLKDNSRSEALRAAIASDRFSDVLDEKHASAMGYVKSLTCTPSEIQPEAIVRMRNAGFTDGEILEVNQVVAYFSYANRTVLGLGVTTEGDILGLSPNDSDDENNWSHQ